MHSIYHRRRSSQSDSNPRRNVPPLHAIAYPGYSQVNKGQSEIVPKFFDFDSRTEGKDTWNRVFLARQATQNFSGLCPPSAPMAQI
jgi:hypothetical protein